MFYIGYFNKGIILNRFFLLGWVKSLNLSGWDEAFEYEVGGGGGGVGILYSVCTYRYTQICGSGNCPKEEEEEGRVFGSMHKLRSTFFGNFAVLLRWLAFCTCVCVCFVKKRDNFFFKKYIILFLFILWEA